MDELLLLEEVWYAGVPGAGGDDAIFAIGSKGLLQVIQDRFLKDKPLLAALELGICASGQQDG